MAQHNTVGKIGEDIAARWLTDNRYSIVEKNYRKKWGEIDIVARGTGGIHFVEVKSVSYGTKLELNSAISRETWRPEENVHRSKLQRLGRAIQTWLGEHKYKEKWQIDVLTVRLVQTEHYAVVKLIENIVLE
jgi:putative endonuclease